MKWINFIVVQIILVLLVSAVIYLHKDKATIVKVPPTELSQWYKPENKRQVWLHNMFKLRREMQAVEFYAQRKDDKLLQKWANDLDQHYRKIAEMVPSWRNKVDTSILENIKSHVKNQNYNDILSATQALQNNCQACHNDYQAITALTYRAADFSTININEATSFNSHMQSLTKQVNQIKIASQDGMPDLAVSTLQQLKKGMSQLGETCVDCHQKDQKNYPSAQMQQTLVSLEHNLQNGSLKEQGRDLGTLAVLACARCHGTHRLTSGAKNLLSTPVNLAELLKH